MDIVCNIRFVGSDNPNLKSVNTHTSPNQGRVSEITSKKACCGGNTHTHTQPWYTHIPRHKLPHKRRRQSDCVKDAGWVM